MPIQTNADLTAWAREQLQLDESAPSGQARQAYMRRLSEEEFMPPAHLPYALAVVEGRAGPPSANEDEVWSEVGDRQRQRVEEFAARFFEIPVDDRRAQWTNWKADCAGAPALLYRLNRLELGLALEPNKIAIADPTVRELMLEASRIFVMRPIDAAMARAAFLRREITASEAGMERWAKAAAALKMSFPHYADLAPELIQQLIQSRITAKKLARRRKQLAGRGVGKLITKALAKPTQAATPSNENPKSGPPYFLIYLLVAGVVAIFRAMSNSSSPTPNPTQFQYDPARRSYIEEILKQNNGTKEEQQINEAVMKSLTARQEFKIGEKGLVPVDKNKDGKTKQPIPSGNPPP